MRICDRSDEDLSEEHANGKAEEEETVVEEPEESESKEDDNTSDKEYQDETEEESEEREDRPDEEDPWNPIVQIWSNPLYNPDPQRISYSTDPSISVECSEVQKEGRKKSKDEIESRKEIQKSPIEEGKEETIETESVSMGTTREDASLKLPVFHGTKRDDAEQHWFTCEAVWAVKQTPNEKAKIA